MLFCFFLFAVLFILTDFMKYDAIIINGISHNKKEVSIVKKLMSWTLVVVILLVMTGTALAEWPGAAPEQDIPEVPECHFATIKANEATGQPLLTYIEGITPILEIDGLFFKDLNNNGILDTYEDYRNDIEARTSDLVNQMTVEEKAGLMLHINASNDIVSDSEKALPHYVNEYHVIHYLDNTNGTPDKLTNRHNYMQQIAENTRLGIPITVSCDRQYNAWGGFVDSPHDAFGASGNVELSSKIWELHAKESRAVGYHLVLGPYGVELSVFNGEDPAYVANMTTAEVTSVMTSMYTCVKHFIASGGATGISFTYKRSPAQNYENQMVSWKAAIEAGTQWIMTNGYNQGLSNTVNVDYDQETMNYLRNTLGYEGVVLTDWGAMGSEDRNIWDNMGGSDGITADGIDLNKFTVPQRYAWVINNGVDQLGGVGVQYHHFLVEAIKDKLISQERIDLACSRILHIKFDLGLFENPYNDISQAMTICASEEYIASPWELVDSDTLATARNPELVELERQLQAHAAVLVKNDNALLPLKGKEKLYFTANDDFTAALYAKNAEQYFTVVDSMESADIVVIDITRMDDAAELAIEDAKETGKKLIITANGISPSTFMIESADALIYLNFSRGSDHGKAMSGFLTTTEACVYTDLLIGKREPKGMIVKEIARNEASAVDQWLDLAGDIGAAPEVRLILLALMRENPFVSIPNNYGDALLCYEYGMRYGQHPEFVYDTLLLPTKVQKGVLMKWGAAFDVLESVQATAKVGEPYTVRFLLWNNGADGMTTVQAYDGETLIADKIEAVNGGEWRIVTMDLVFEAAGDHILTIGDLSAVITVEE